MKVFDEFVSGHAFGMYGEAVTSTIVLSTSFVLVSARFLLRLMLFSVRLRHRRNSGVRFDDDLMLPLMIVLNDVGNGVFSSSESMSSNSMQSSSIDSMESEDKLLNGLKQLVLFGEAFFTTIIGVGVFFGDWRVSVWAKVNSFRLLWLKPESTEL